MKTHFGGCHCGAVKFEVIAPADITVNECNCSICSMTGYLHLIVPAERFKLINGQEDLTTYKFNTGTASHLFCRHCGIKSFYIPRSHPDGVSVNVRCLKPETLGKISLKATDGRNWEKHYKSGRGEFQN